MTRSVTTATTAAAAGIGGTTLATNPHVVAVSGRFFGE